MGEWVNGLMKRRKRLAALLILGLTLYMILRWFEYAKIYHPSRILDGSGADLDRPFEEVQCTASDGVGLHGWYFPANTNSPRGHLAMLVCHGNGGNISHRLDLCQVLLETGVNVFLFDYRGYGRS